MEPLSKLLDLSGRSAIVTGGAKGIGYGIVLRLAQAGAHVLIADIDEQCATAAIKELSEQSMRVSSLHVDVSVENDIKTMIDTCQREFGSIDILVNNAGIYPPVPVAQMSK